MKETIYSGLFEDEIAELLRSLPFRSIIQIGEHMELYPSAGMYEDGISSSGNGMFSIYMDGRRTGGTINTRRLIEILAHATFTVKEEQ